MNDQHASKTSVENVENVSSPTQYAAFVAFEVQSGQELSRWNDWITESIWESHNLSAMSAGLCNSTADRPEFTALAEMCLRPKRHADYADMQQFAIFIFGCQGWQEG